MTNEYTKYKTFCIYPTKYVIMHSDMHYTHAYIFGTCMMPDILYVHLCVHYVIQEYLYRSYKAQEQPAPYNMHLQDLHTASDANKVQIVHPCVHLENLCGLLHLPICMYTIHA